MRVRVNGRDAELEPGATVRSVVDRYARSSAGAGIAVALNGEVVARSAWSETELSEDDRVEVLGAIGGGTGDRQRNLPTVGE